MRKIFFVNCAHRANEKRKKKGTSEYSTVVNFGFGVSTPTFTNESPKTNQIPFQTHFSIRFRSTTRQRIFLESQKTKLDSTSRKACTGSVLFHHVYRFFLNIPVSNKKELLHDCNTFCFNGEVHLIISYMCEND